MAQSKEFFTRIQHKHDVEANWNKAVNFVPLAGEIIIYDKDEGHDYTRIKIGDGSTKINELPFTNSWEYIDNKPLLEDVVYVGDENDEDGGIIDTSLFNAVYPVGSIYMTVNPVNPASLFGGTWEPIYDRFLLAAGGSYPAGATGGEATHTLTIEEMPWHDHAIMAGYGEALNNTVDSYRYQTWGSNGYGAKTGFLGAQGTGGSQPHNNMPPYLAVYMWKRIA